jgi:phosphoglucosamine mutase
VADDRRAGDEGRQAAAQHFLRGSHRHRVVIGKDTRLSGYMLENALVAGFTSVGMDVVLFGPIPTPAVALLTRSMRADLGVMISASHNPYEDNGIKLFGPMASSFPMRTSLRSRHAGRGQPLARRAEGHRPGPPDRGCARPLYPCGQSSSCPTICASMACSIVVDCANGAAYQVAPSALWELGAK